MSRLTTRRAGGERGFVACAIDSTIFAVAIEHVQEIIIPAGLSPLPHAPPGIIGAVDHRGEIVPILDLGLRIGVGETTAFRRKWVIVRIADRALGVVVGNVIEVFRVDDADIRPAPDVGDDALRTCSSVVTFAQRMAFILDLDSLALLAEMKATRRQLA